MTATRAPRPVRPVRPERSSPAAPARARAAANVVGRTPGSAAPGLAPTSPARVPANTVPANTVPVPRTRPQPRPQPAPRPPLRIVTPPDPEVRARRRRRLWVGALAGLACAGLFAIVGVRVLLAQGQPAVDRLEAEITAAQAESQRLRLDVARLESPARIVAEAQARLGMIPPANVVYLPPLTPPAG